MKILRIYLIQLFVLFNLIGNAQINDSRVMLQGFYWESCSDKEQWYNFVKSKVNEIHEARFDMIWLPPPSYAGCESNGSEGYAPKRYFDLNNVYGTEEEQIELLSALLKNGIEPIADIVINHRNGDTSWADFEQPYWDISAIVREDEAFYEKCSELRGKAKDAKYEEECAIEYLHQSFCDNCYKSEGDKCATTYQYPSYRDIAHENPIVRKDIKKFLQNLKAIGYRGWRYDMVHGYHAKWIAEYNKASQPTFSVGEYDWSDERYGERRGWVWHSAREAGNLETASSVFDFSVFYALKRILTENKKYTNLKGSGSGLGLIGDHTDGNNWKNKAVTFIENHDTGFRKDDENHKFDTFKDGEEAQQAYAYILTHPGVPCVYWKHYFQWKNNGLPEAIKVLINARKVAGVHSGSNVYIQKNAIKKEVYAAQVEGSNGKLYVRIGGTDDQWQPTMSYPNAKFKEYGKGEHWKVWVELKGNPQVQLAPLNTPIQLNINDQAVFNTNQNIE